MSTHTALRATGRSLVDPAFFTRLSRRVAKTNRLDIARAEAITDQALAYLATSATKPEDAPTLYMSADVDPAWHEFITFTADYDRFFQRPGWHKVHHHPSDGWGGATYPPPEDAIPPTVDAIRATGYEVIPHLWSAKTDCSDDGGTPNPLPCGDHG